jgi:tRNA(Ile)-lysidine synthase
LVVVAVSGGADSVALLYVLWKLKGDLGVDIVAAHLNHGIRGADADEDARFVQDLEAKLNIACVVETADVPRISRQSRTGIEETARTVRYEFLEKVAASAHASRIAVAHTSDDQVETVLLNILRGTGTDGLAGMPPVRGKIIRPLIDVSRREVEAYLVEGGLRWRTDETNLDPGYSRNRVRIELLPYLEEKFNPRIREAVLSLSRIARDETAMARAEAERLFRSAALEAGPGRVALDAEMLRRFDRALQRRCIRMAVEMVKGDLRDVEYGQVDRIVESLNREQDLSVTMPSGQVYASLSAGEFRVFRTEEPVLVDFERDVIVPGRTEVQELGVAVETAFVDPAERPRTTHETVIDPAKLVGALRVRMWKPGDRMIPFGMSGHKKLQDLFTDRKVPRLDRYRTPVFVDDEKIVWVAGLSVSESVRISDATTSALRIEVGQAARSVADS